MRQPRVLRSFKRAFIGIKIGYSDPMMWRHTVTSAVVIVCSIYYKLTQEQLAIVILCCGAVLGFELLNTGIEKMAKEHQNPRPSLDVSSTGVMFMSIATAAVGLIFLIPKCVSDPMVLIIATFIVPLTWMVIN